MAGICLAGPLQAELSRTFTQETGYVASDSGLYLDVYNSTGVWTRASPSQLRMGLGGSEFSFGPDNIGIKRLFMPQVAGYLVTGLQSGTETLMLRMGAAWTLVRPGIVINLNPEINKESDSYALQLNTGLFYPSRLGANLGQLAFGGEASLPLGSGQRPGFALGFRWILSDDRFTMDIIVAGDGGSANKGSVGTPAALRLNWRLR